MKTDPLSDSVSEQYARWLYPQPILNLEAWLADNWQWLDPSHSHRLFWPDRAYRPDLDILVAGCGTNQAAVLAFTNPHASVVAIDVSQPSLDHHRFLKQKHALSNLELRLLPIEEAEKLERTFDLIVTTGVIHHLANPEEGTKALARCLRSDGVLAIMLYAKYGRVGVEMLQEAFREMGLDQSDASVNTVKEALRELSPDHPVRSYLALAPDLEFDAGLVDTFLHGRERSFTIESCRELVSAADLVFQDLFFKAPYYPPPPPRSAFFSSIARLPAEKQFSIMERINFQNACHFFMACRPERTPSSYRIDFVSGDTLFYVPSFRHRCGLDGDEIVRPNWRTRLTGQQLSVIQRIDGQSTVAEIVESIRREGPQSGAADGRIEAETRAVLEVLWKWDFLQFSIRRPDKAAVL
jgi:SAM-dependent methyltransferase